MALKKDPEGEEVVVLSPSREAVTINGKLFYSEGDGCWNTIRLRKEVLHEFPQLKEKSGSFGYTMIVSKNKDGFDKSIKEIDKNTIPVLLFFNKNGKENDKNK